MRNHINKNLYHFNVNIDIIKDDDKLYTRIGKTPFEVKRTYSKNLSIDYDNFSPDIAIVDIRQLLRYTANYDIITLKVLFTFIYYLEPNTNYVRFNKNSVSVVLTDSHTSNAIQENSAISVAIQQLKLDNIIAKTNKNELYIINHNYFYKGDLNKFAENYYKLYGDWTPVDRDDRNRVILPQKNNNVNLTAYRKYKIDKSLELLKTQTMDFKVIKK